MSQRQDGRRLIPDNIGGIETFTDNVPFVGAIEFQDGLFISGILFLALFIGDLAPSFIPQKQLIALGLGFSVSLILLLAKPDYLTLSQTAQNYYDFWKSVKEYNMDMSKSVESVKTNEDPDTRRLIGINRIYPEYDVIEKNNGTALSIIELSGVDLNVTATQEDWQTYQNRFVSKLEGSIDEKFQIYMPMRQYDPSEQISSHEERLEDPKIKNNPILEQYVQNRIGFHQQYAEQGYYRKYYIIVQTKKSEVVLDKSFEKTGIEAVVSSIGDWAENWYAAFFKTRTQMLSSREITHKQLTEAQEKGQKYANLFDEGGSGSSGGQNARMLSGDECAVVLKEFWEGKTITDDNNQNFIRESPFVMGPENLSGDTHD